MMMHVLKHLTKLGFIDGDEWLIASCNPFRDQTFEVVLIPRDLAQERSKGAVETRNGLDTCLSAACFSNIALMSFEIFLHSRTYSAVISGIKAVVPHAKERS
jgi:uncharacterized membrane protein